MNQTGKRTRALAPLLGLLFCLVLLPLLCGRAQATVDYVKIKLRNGTELELGYGYGIADNSAAAVTASSGGVAYYKDGTLTLNGLQAEYIYAPLSSSLTIQVNGANTLNGWVEAGGNYSHCGIYSNGNLTIKGSGTLNISTASYSIDSSFYGIYCDSSLTLDGAKVTANAVSGANGSYGIYAKEGITVSGGTLDITAKNIGIYCYAGSIGIKGGAKVEINGTPTNGIYIYGHGQDKTLTISDSGTVVNIPAVTGYAVGNCSTVTTDADTATANIIVEKGAKLTIDSCKDGLHSEHSGVRIADSDMTVTNATGYGIWLQGGAGILEITGSSVVALTGGSSAVKVDNGAASKINLTGSGGSVTMRKTGTGGTETNYAMVGWVELGDNTAVSGGTIRNKRHSTNPKARSIEGNALTFTYDATQLKISGYDNKNDMYFYPEDWGWLKFEENKAIVLQFMVTTGDNANWTKTGSLPDGLTWEQRAGYGFIEGTPTTVGQEYSVTIKAEVNGKEATVTLTGTVQDATRTGTLFIGSTDFPINSNAGNLTSYGWSWDRATQVLTLKNFSADFGGNNIRMVDAKEGDDPLPLYIHLEGNTNRIYLDRSHSASAAIQSHYGVCITGEPNSKLEIVLDNASADYGILCNNSDAFGNEITIGEGVTVKFCIKNESKNVTAIYTNNGDVTLLGSVEITRYNTTDNLSVTGIAVGKTHCVNIGNGPSSRASLLLDYLYAKDTTAIKAGGVIVNTATDNVAIKTDFDGEYTETFKSIELIPESITDGRTRGLYVISGKLDMRGVKSTVVSGRGPVFLSGSADVKIMGYGKSNAGIYLTGEGSDVTIAPGGKLNMDFVSYGIRTDGKLRVGEMGHAAATLKVDDAKEIAVSANKGVEICGSSTVDLTTTGTTVVSTINNDGDNGPSTVDLTEGGYVKLKSTASPAATQVWRGPIRLGDSTLCTGTVNTMNAPAGYAQYNAQTGADGSSNGTMDFSYATAREVTVYCSDPNTITAVKDGVQVALERKGTSPSSYYVFKAAQGSNVTLTAAAGDGYRFKGWGTGDGGGRTEAEMTIKIGGSHIELRPVFEALPTTLVLTVPAAPSSGAELEDGLSANAGTVNVASKGMGNSENFNLWSVYNNENFRQGYLYKFTIQISADDGSLDKIDAVHMKLDGSDVEMPVEYTDGGDLFTLYLYVVCGVGAKYDGPLYEGNTFPAVTSARPELYTAEIGWSDTIPAAASDYGLTFAPVSGTACIFGSVVEGGSTKLTGTVNDTSVDLTQSVDADGWKLTGSYKPEIRSAGEKPAGVTVGGTVKSYNPNNAVTIRLMQEGAEKYRTTIGATTGSGQVTQTFSIGSVAVGTYDLVVTKSGHLTYTVKNVKVGAEALDLTAMTGKAYQTITLLAGDVNGDGSITEDDVSVIRYSTNINKATASAENKLADVNGDGSVTEDDVSIVRYSTHINKGIANCTYQFEEG